MHLLISTYMTDSLSVSSETDEVCLKCTSQVALYFSMQGRSAFLTLKQTLFKKKDTSFEPGNVCLFVAVKENGNMVITQGYCAVCKE